MCVWFFFFVCQHLFGGDKGGLISEFQTDLVFDLVFAVSSRTARGVSKKQNKQTKKVGIKGG